MGSGSNYIENEVLDHVFKVGDYPAPDNLYIAFCLSTVEEDDTGTTLPSEVSGGDYVRQVCNTWDAAAGGATENSQAEEWPQATADWGTITDFAICDHSTGGNVIAFGKLGTARQIQSGDTARIATGDLDITLD